MARTVTNLVLGVKCMKCHESIEVGEECVQGDDYRQRWHLQCAPETITS